MTLVQLGSHDVTRATQDLGVPAAGECDKSQGDIIGDAGGGAQVQLATSQLPLPKHPNQKPASL